MTVDSIKHQIGNVEKLGAGFMFSETTNAIARHSSEQEINEIFNREVMIFRGWLNDLSKAV